MQENELKAFIKENSPLIFQYINREILKNIGVISSDFFVRLIDEYFNKKEKEFAKEFDDKISMYDQIELGNDGKLAFKEGSELAELDKKAPKTFEYLQKKIKDLENA